MMRRILKGIYSNAFALLQHPNGREFGWCLKARRVAESTASTTDVIGWWDDNEHRYTHFAMVARDYLAIAASSVPSEHAFSRAGSDYQEQDLPCLAHSKHHYVPSVLASQAQGDKGKKGRVQPPQA
jgi:hypothetical protein